MDWSPTKVDVDDDGSCHSSITDAQRFDGAPNDLPNFDFEIPRNEFFTNAESMTEVLNELHRKNEDTISLRMMDFTEPFLMGQEIIVNLVFGICEELNLPTPVRFLAVDLLDRFSMVFFIRLKKYVFDSIESKVKLEKWTKIVDRIPGHWILRLLSCIQVASKIVERVKELQVSKIKNILEDHGYRYSVKSIKSSELRVCFDLNFKVNMLTSFTALETLVGLVEHPQLKKHANAIFALGVPLLDMIYLNRETLYEQLFEELGYSKGKNSPDSSYDKLMNLRDSLDNMWVAASVTISSASLLGKNLDHLAHIEMANALGGRRSSMEISTFANIISSSVVLQETSETHQIRNDLP